MTQPTGSNVSRDALVAAAAAHTVTRTRQNMLAWLRRLFARGQWRRTDAEVFSHAVVPIVQGAQRHIAQTTAVSLLRQVEQHGGSASLDGFDPTQYPRKADPLEVYQRPFHAVWSDLANGHDLPTAVDHGQTRLEQIAATDLQLAKTNAAQHVLSGAEGIVGYRRVLNLPSCGLCVVASTQRYQKSNLMAIHPGCDCGEEPIYGTEDTGQVIDDQLLIAAHDAIEQRFGVSDSGARSPDYRKVLLDRLHVHDHPEMGPLLTVLPQKVNK